MSRLPKPGSDSGTWGDILNDYLNQEHNSDGSLKNVVRPSDTRLTDQRTPTDGSVTDAKITSGGLSPSSINGGIISLGETSTTAYRGDRGKTAYDTALLAAPATRIPYLAVSDYYDSGSVSTDIGPAINRAIVAAAALTTPAQVVLPAVSAPVVTQITPAPYVDVIGQGWGKTVLRPQAGKHAIYDLSFTKAAPLHDMGFYDFEIDGSAQTGLYKGIFIQWLQRVKFEHLYIHDTGATGLGCDFLIDSLIDDVVAVNCGRNGNGTSGGCAGIGIGTYQTSDWYGSLTVRSAVARSNKRAGIFFETQPVGGVHVSQEGVKVIAPECELNGDHGLGDAGCSGLQVIGGHSKSNGVSGFAVYAGTIANSIPGDEGVVTGLDCYSNTSIGFYFAGTTALPSHYTLQQVKARLNGTYGVQAYATVAGTMGHLTVQNSDIELNGKAGVCLIATPTVMDRVDIIDNRIRGNGTDTVNGTAETRSGIYLGGIINNVNVKRNRAYDDQAVKTQTYGFTVATSATIGNLDERDNDWRDNLTGARDIAGAISAITIASDTFTDTDGVTVPNHAMTLGGPWTTHSSYNNNGVITDANRVMSSSTTLTIGYYCSAVPQTPDYDVSADLYVADPHGSMGVAGRMLTTAETMYFVRYNVVTTRWELYSLVAGSAVSLGTYSQSLTNGNTYNVRLSMVGSILNVYIDGTLRIGPITNNAVVAVGRAGIRGVGGTSGGTKATSYHLDNFLVSAAGVSFAQRNRGYNPVGVVTVAVPATTVSVAAAAYDRTFYITAGASACTIAVDTATITVPAATCVAVNVPAMVTMTPTFTAAPTWVVVGQ